MPADYTARNNLPESVMALSVGHGRVNGLSLVWSRNRASLPSPFCTDSSDQQRLGYIVMDMPEILHAGTHA